MAIAHIDELIRYYERHLGGLDERDVYDTETPLVLIARDDIQERWEDLTPEQRRRVQELDDVLVAKYKHVANVLPSSLSTDRRHWWWFLHEGPQVREQAQEAA
ncbi:MAG: hypothetical protein HY678_02870 [Chloroflexi bacterium]|nr:hypothetical protein [Chloroflexota bacterium]